MNVKLICITKFIFQCEQRISQTYNGIQNSRKYAHVYWCISHNHQTFGTHGQNQCNDMLGKSYCHPDVLAKGLPRQCWAWCSVDWREASKARYNYGTVSHPARKLDYWVSTPRHIHGIRCSMWVLWPIRSRPWPVVLCSCRAGPSTSMCPMQCRRRWPFREYPFHSAYIEHRTTH